MVSDRLKQVIIRKLELEDWDISDETFPSDIPGWDSLNHLRIISAIEDEFDIKLRGMDVMRIATMADLQAIISRKQGSR